MRLRQITAAIMGLLIFSGCSKSSNTNGGNGGGGGGGNGTTQQAYVADLTGGYISASGTWAKAIRMQKDGKILVLGSQWFVRLEKDGVTVDKTFSPLPQLASSADINSIELQDDGKIIAFGKFTLTGGRKGIVRLNTDGSLDESFKNPVLDINYQAQAINIYAIRLLANGKMVIAGAFSYKTPTSYGNGIARLNSDQSLDYSFVSPISAGDVYNVRGMLPLSGGGYLLTGYGAIKINDGVNYAIVRIGADGAFDKSYVFDAAGVFKAASMISGDLKELPDGKVLMGWYSGGVQDYTSHVTRLNPDGSVDAGFTSFDFGGYVRSLLVLPDNSILTGNDPNGNLPYVKKYLPYLNSSGKEDTTFKPEFKSGTSIFSLASVDENTLLVGGNLYFGDKKYAVVRFKKNK